MFIDTHAHLTMPEYSDLSEVLARAKEKKIEAIINASFDLESSRDSVKLANCHDFIYAAVGIHPNDAQLVDEKSISEIKQLARDKKVVAIGETGLDYFHKTVSADIQQKAFRIFINLAQELGLPLIIHAREADLDVIRIMREENKGKLKAVFHCFAGGQDLIRFADEMNYMISFTGNITFKKAQILRDQAKIIPLDRLMIETDCPYLAPQIVRGQRNEPANVVYVAEEIAKAKGLPIEDIALKTSDNAKRFFSLP